MAKGNLSFCHSMHSALRKDAVGFPKCFFLHAKIYFPNIYKHKNGAPAGYGRHAVWCVYVFMRLYVTRCPEPSLPWQPS